VHLRLEGLDIDLDGGRPRATGTASTIISHPTYTGNGWIVQLCWHTKKEADRVERTLGFPLLAQDLLP
jgi:hypothetical protein